MSSRRRWLLPAGIEELLPANAAILESYRRTLLDLYSSWGYRLVQPPFIEFLDSLLIGDSEDLNLQTFKLTDQLTGRTLGVRADMTPQVARIDAHMLKEEGPARLCYCGTVLLTRPEVAGGTRSPMQIGAELYGHDGIASDLEIIELMLTTMQACNINEVLLDLGHAGLFSALVEQLACDQAKESELFDLVQRKSMPDIEEFLQSFACDQTTKDAIIALINLHGSSEVLQQAKQELKAGGDKVMQCIAYVEQLSDALCKRFPNLKIHYDLADLRGYHYQNDVVFAAFDLRNGDELARGGRYNNIGEVFGRARPATGFSADLKKLIAAGSTDQPATQAAIYAPASDEDTLIEKISALRAQGETVIKALSSDDAEAQLLHCDRHLLKENNEWVVKAL